jgi:hypothetical protein
MQTGECLDIDILSKVFHGCQRINKTVDPQEKQVLEADHIGKCKANFKGSASSMEHRINISCSTQNILGMEIAKRLVK